MTQTSPDDTPDDKATTAGRPLPQLEIAIRDPLTSEVVPVGGQGEICARGYQAMLGYFDMPDRTRETVDAEGWLRTGDIGTLDDRGYLTVTGRLPLTGSGKIQKYRLQEQIDRAELPELH